MKLTIKELKTIIKEVIEESLVEEADPREFSFKELIQRLEDLEELT